MIVGPVTFLAPLALLGLLALPLIWFVLRITPPRPLEQTFPPLRLLLDVKTEEETPQSIPPWLLLFRLLLGTLIAIALAKPILFKPAEETSKPLVLVIDNGWAAAGNWPAIIREAESLTKQAISENNQVALYTSIDLRGENETGFTSAPQALERIKRLQPLPYAPRRAETAEQLSAADLTNVDVLWLSDGVDYGHSANINDILGGVQGARIMLPIAENAPVLAGETQETAEGFRSVWHRVDTNGLRSLSVAAYGPKGRIIGRADLQFTPGASTAEADFKLPAELRNQVSYVRIENMASAGSIKLLDDSWGRPLVGLLKGSDENTQPLLSEWHYIEKALAPNADIYKGDIDELAALSPAIIFMTDRARTDSELLKTYVEEGGFLVRFAGPKLAKRSDSLLPVTLRRGDRDLGGALAWETPQGFAAFSEDSPFFGLSPSKDIKIKKQVMAQPSAETDSHTWARLEDGAPIVTSAPMGSGRVVLFHVTAGPDWSGLPISGLYVDMLKRILPLARSTRVQAEVGTGDWTIERGLNGYGQLGTPPQNASPIANDGFANTAASPLTPAGLYRQGLRRQALNITSSPTDYSALKPSGMTRTVYGGRKPKSLSGMLLGIAALMLALDVLMSLLASGRMRIRNPRAATTVLALVCMMMMAALPTDSYAQDGPQNDALELHLAYVVTGDSAIDSLSRAGLEGLAFELTRRTTIEPAGVRAINIETDELAFYPFLYWPVARDARPLSDKASTALNQYMASGGTIVFDTQDADRNKLLGAETHPGLKTISKSLDIPRMSKPPSGHVITKSYFLINSYPGRYVDGELWVEADSRGTARDGVSSVIVGANDWAAAWAKDDQGRVMTVIENDIPRQREMSYRFGINLAMYTLAGNYKGDQVHAAKIVERLGGAPELANPEPDAPSRIELEFNKNNDGEEEE